LPNRHSGSYLKFRPACVQADHRVSGRIERAVGQICAWAAWRGELTGRAWLADIPPPKPQD
jgi:hypothetical protein